MKPILVLVLILVFAAPVLAQWNGVTIYEPDPNSFEEQYGLGRPIIDSNGNLWMSQQNNSVTPSVSSIIKITTPGFVVSTFYTFPSSITATLCARDGSGNLYGIAADSTSSSIYKLTSKAVYSTIYTFASGTPVDIYRAASGNFYGYLGSSLFKVTAAGKFSTLHTFLEGNAPNDFPIVNTAGNLFGTATGGSLGFGFIFERTSGGKYSVLYNFTGGADGAYPTGKLTQNASGLMYGTTEYGGNINLASCYGTGLPNGCGTVFSISSTGKFGVLYAFNDTTDGIYQPVGSVTLDSVGNVYGPAIDQGNSSYYYNSAYQVTPTGVATSIGGCGSGIPSAFAIDKSGNLYCTTTGLGDIGITGVFELVNPN
jgi:hypothetical protein